MNIGEREDFEEYDKSLNENVAGTNLSPQCSHFFVSTDFIKKVLPLHKLSQLLFANIDNHILFIGTGTIIYIQLGFIIDILI